MNPGQELMLGAVLVAAFCYGLYRYIQSRKKSGPSGTGGGGGGGGKIHRK